MGGLAVLLGEEARDEFGDKILHRLAARGGDRFEAVACRTGDARGEKNWAVHHTSYYALLRVCAQSENHRCLDVVCSL